MARKTIKRPSAAARRSEFQPHDLLLAGIGAVSLGRKQAAHLYANGFHNAAVLRELAEEAAQNAAKTIGGTVTALRKQAKAKSAPVKKQVLALANEAIAQAQTRLAPVLVRLGVKKAPAKRATPRKKAGTRRTRKAA